MADATSITPSVNWILSGGSGARTRTPRVSPSPLSLRALHGTTRSLDSGLGAAQARERKDQLGHWESEEFRNDAFGNVLQSRTGQSDNGGGYECSTRVRQALLVRHTRPADDSRSDHVRGHLRCVDIHHVYERTIASLLPRERPGQPHRANAECLTLSRACPATSPRSRDTALHLRGRRVRSLR